MSQKRIVLITGSSRGIGKYLAENFKKSGHYVIGVSRSSEGDSCDHHFAFDLAETERIPDLFREIRSLVGSLDILINNAAINPAIMPAAICPMTLLQRTFAVNFFSASAMCVGAVKLMRKRGAGRIINMGSMAIAHEVAGESAYTSSKAALRAYTRVLAKEVSLLGITANMLCPSAVPTDLMSQIRPEELSKVLARNAIPQVGTLDDVFQACAWLASQEASAVTGQVIYLGGV